MADLRTALSGLGFTDVKTLLNSGNAAFSVPAKDKRDPAALETAIEAAVTRQAGFVSRVTLISGQELDAIIASNPFPHAVSQPSRFLVAILGHHADRSILAPWSRQRDAAGTFHAEDRAAYIWCPDGITQSPWPLAIDRALKEGVTTRNWATLAKLRALL